MNNKTSSKYHASVTSSFSKTKVSFVFRSTKDLHKIPLETWVFLHTLFLKNKVQINKNNYTTMLFMSKQVSLPKNSSILQKIKISPKRHIHPFCTKPFNWNSSDCKFLTLFRITKPQFRARSNPYSKCYIFPPDWFNSVILSACRGVMLLSGY